MMRDWMVETKLHEPSQRKLKNQEPTGLANYFSKLYFFFSSGV